jgi:hypothetical protein
MPDMRDILFLRKFVDWNKIDQYPDVNDMFKAMVMDQRLAQEAKQKNRNNWIDAFIKDNKRGIRQAVRDLWSNGYQPYIAPKKDRKIYVDVNGYKQSDGGLLIPKFAKGE